MRAAARPTHNQPGLHALLALNNGLAAWYNSTMLYRGLRKQGVLTHSTGWRRLWTQSIAGNVVMVAFLWWFSRDAQYWIEMRASRAWHMSLLVAGGAACYFGTMRCCWVCGVSHLRVQPVRRPAASVAGSERWNWFGVCITCGLGTAVAC